ncbi:MAG: hypothetical protein JSS66_18110 [Armatimonadetes bacterium]|nr:hypothetical protein [Armatimonadota bacterium]
MGTLLLAMVTMAPPVDVETRTLREGEESGSGSYLLFQRIATRSGFTLWSKGIYPGGNVGYGETEYTLHGMPVRSAQEGFWNDRWNVFTTHYKSKGAIQSINGVVTTSHLPAKEFQNPTVLWFWKTHPRIGSVVTVKFLAQNTLDIFQIRFTYEGDEKVKLVGREVVLHRVREVPLSSHEGVYTIWWYDDKGMGVKRYHKTTKQEYSNELLSWR